MLILQMSTNFECISVLILSVFLISNVIPSTRNVDAKSLPPKQIHHRQQQLFKSQAHNQHDEPRFPLVRNSLRQRYRTPPRTSAAAAAAASSLRATSSRRPPPRTTATTTSPTRAYMNDIEYDLRLRQLMEDLVLYSRLDNQNHAVHTLLPMDLKDEYQQRIQEKPTTVKPTRRRTKTTVSPPPSAAAGVPLASLTTRPALATTARPKLTTINNKITTNNIKANYQQQQQQHYDNKDLETGSSVSTSSSSPWLSPLPQMLFNDGQNSSTLASATAASLSSASFKDSLLDYVLHEYMTKTKQNLTELLQANKTKAPAFGDSQKIRQQLEFLQKNAEKFKKFQQVEERTKNATAASEWNVIREIEAIQRHELVAQLREATQNDDVNAKHANVLESLKSPTNSEKQYVDNMTELRTNEKGIEKTAGGNGTNNSSVNFMGEIALRAEGNISQNLNAGESPDKFENASSSTVLLTSDNNVKMADLREQANFKEGHHNILARDKSGAYLLFPEEFTNQSVTNSSFFNIQALVTEMATPPYRKEEKTQNEANNTTTGSSMLKHTVTPKETLDNFTEGISHHYSLINDFGSGTELPADDTTKFENEFNQNTDNSSLAEGLNQDVEEEEGLDKIKTESATERIDSGIVHDFGSPKEVPEKGMTKIEGESKNVAIDSYLHQVLNQYLDSAKEVLGEIKIESTTESISQDYSLIHDFGSAAEVGEKAMTKIQDKSNKPALDSSLDHELNQDIQTTKEALAEYRNTTESISLIHNFGSAAEVGEKAMTVDEDKSNKPAIHSPLLAQELNHGTDPTNDTLAEIEAEATTERISYDSNMTHDISSASEVIEKAMTKIQEKSNKPVIDSPLDQKLNQGVESTKEALGEIKNRHTTESISLIHNFGSAPEVGEKAMTVVEDKSNEPTNHSPHLAQELNHGTDSTNETLAEIEAETTTERISYDSNMTHDISSAAEVIEKAMTKIEEKSNKPAIDNSLDQKLNQDIESTKVVLGEIKNRHTTESISLIHDFGSAAEVGEKAMTVVEDKSNKPAIDSPLLAQELDQGTDSTNETLIEIETETTTERISYDSSLTHDLSSASEIIEKAMTKIEEKSDKPAIDSSLDQGLNQDIESTNEALGNIKNRHTTESISLHIFGSAAEIEEKAMTVVEDKSNKPTIHSPHLAQELNHGTDSTNETLAEIEAETTTERISHDYTLLNDLGSATKLAERVMTKVEDEFKKPAADTSPDLNRDMESKKETLDEIVTKTTTEGITYDSKMTHDFGSTIEVAGQTDQDVANKSDTYNSLSLDKTDIETSTERVSYDYSAAHDFGSASEITGMSEDNKPIDNSLWQEPQDILQEIRVETTTERTSYDANTAHDFMSTMEITEKAMPKIEEFNKTADSSLGQELNQGLKSTKEALDVTETKFGSATEIAEKGQTKFDDEFETFAADSSLGQERNQNIDTKNETLDEIKTETTTKRISYDYGLFNDSSSAAEITKGTMSNIEDKPNKTYIDSSLGQELNQDIKSIKEALDEIQTETTTERISHDYSLLNDFGPATQMVAQMVMTKAEEKSNKTAVNIPLGQELIQDIESTKEGLAGIEIETTTERISHNYSVLNDLGSATEEPKNILNKKTATDSLLGQKLNRDVEEDGFGSTTEITEKAMAKVEDEFKSTAVDSSLGQELNQDLKSIQESLYEIETDPRTSSYSSISNNLGSATEIALKDGKDQTNKPSTNSTLRQEFSEDMKSTKETSNEIPTEATTEGISPDSSTANFSSFSTKITFDANDDNITSPESAAKQTSNAILIKATTEGISPDASTANVSSFSTKIIFNVNDHNKISLGSNAMSTGNINGNNFNNITLNSTLLRNGPSTSIKHMNPEAIKVQSLKDSENIKKAQDSSERAQSTNITALESTDVLEIAHKFDNGINEQPTTPELATKSIEESKSHMPMKLKFEFLPSILENSTTPIATTSNNVSSNIGSELLSSELPTKNFQHTESQTELTNTKISTKTPSTELPIIKKLNSENHITKMPNEILKITETTELPETELPTTPHMGSEMSILNLPANQQNMEKPNTEMLTTTVIPTTDFSITDKTITTKELPTAKPLATETLTTQMPATKTPTPADQSKKVFSATNIPTATTININDLLTIDEPTATLPTIEVKAARPTVDHPNESAGFQNPKISKTNFSNIEMSTADELNEKFPTTEFTTVMPTIYISPTKGKSEMVLPTTIITPIQTTHVSTVDVSSENESTTKKQVTHQNLQEITIDEPSEMLPTTVLPTGDMYASIVPNTDHRGDEYSITELPTTTMKTTTEFSNATDNPTTVLSSEKLPTMKIITSGIVTAQATAVRVSSEKLPINQISTTKLRATTELLSPMKSVVAIHTTLPATESTTTENVTTHLPSTMVPGLATYTTMPTIELSTIEKLSADQISTSTIGVSTTELPSTMLPGVATHTAPPTADLSAKEMVTTDLPTTELPSTMKSVMAIHTTLPTAELTTTEHLTTDLPTTDLPSTMFSGLATDTTMPTIELSTTEKLSTDQISTTKLSPIGLSTTELPSTMLPGVATHTAMPTADLPAIEMVTTVLPSTELPSTMFLELAKHTTIPSIDLSTTDQPMEDSATTAEIEATTTQTYSKRFTTKDAQTSSELPVIDLPTTKIIRKNIPKEEQFSTYFAATELPMDLTVESNKESQITALPTTTIINNNIPKEKESTTYFAELPMDLPVESNTELPITELPTTIISGYIPKEKQPNKYLTATEFPIYLPAESSTELPTTIISKHIPKGDQSSEYIAATELPIHLPAESNTELTITELPTETIISRHIPKEGQSSKYFVATELPTVQIDLSSKVALPIEIASGEYTTGQLPFAKMRATPEAPTTYLPHNVVTTTEYPVPLPVLPNVVQSIEENSELPTKEMSSIKESAKNESRIKLPPTVVPITNTTAAELSLTKLINSSKTIEKIGNSHFPVEGMSRINIQVADQSGIKLLPTKLPITETAIMQKAELSALPTPEQPSKELPTTQLSTETISNDTSVPTTDKTNVQLSTIALPTIESTTQLPTISQPNKELPTTEKTLSSLTEFMAKLEKIHNSESALPIAEFPTTDMLVEFLLNESQNSNETSTTQKLPTEEILSTTKPVSQLPKDLTTTDLVTSGSPLTKLPATELISLELPSPVLSSTVLPVSESPHTKLLLEELPATELQLIELTTTKTEPSESTSKPIELPSSDSSLTSATELLFSKLSSAGVPSTELPSTEVIPPELSQQHTDLPILKSASVNPPALEFLTSEQALIATPSTKLAKTELPPRDITIIKTPSSDLPPVELSPSNWSLTKLQTADLPYAELQGNEMTSSFPHSTELPNMSLVTTNLINEELPTTEMPNTNKSILKDQSTIILSTEPLTIDGSPGEVPSEEVSTELPTTALSNTDETDGKLDFTEPLTSVASPEDVRTGEVFMELPTTVIPNIDLLSTADKLVTTEQLISVPSSVDVHIGEASTELPTILMPNTELLPTKETADKLSTTEPPTTESSTTQSESSLTIPKLPTEKLPIIELIKSTKLPISELPTIEQIFPQLMPLKELPSAMAPTSDMLHRDITNSELPHATKSPTSELPTTMSSSTTLATTKFQIADKTTGDVARVNLTTIKSPQAETLKINHSDSNEENWVPIPVPIGNRYAADKQGDIYNKSNILENLFEARVPQLPQTESEVLVNTTQPNEEGMKEEINSSIVTYPHSTESFVGIEDTQLKTSTKEVGSEQLSSKEISEMVKPVTQDLAWKEESAPIQLNFTKIENNTLSNISTSNIKPEESAIVPQELKNPPNLLNDSITVIPEVLSIEQTSAGTGQPVTEIVWITHSTSVHSPTMESSLDMMVDNHDIMELPFTDDFVLDNSKSQTNSGEGSGDKVVVWVIQTIEKHVPATESVRDNNKTISALRNSSTTEDHLISKAELTELFTPNNSKIGYAAEPTKPAKEEIPARINTSPLAEQPGGVSPTDGENISGVKLEIPLLSTEKPLETFGENLKTLEITSPQTESNFKGEQIVDLKIEDLLSKENTPNFNNNRETEVMRDSNEYAIQNESVENQEKEKSVMNNSNGYPIQDVSLEKQENEKSVTEGLDMGNLPSGNNFGLHEGPFNTRDNEDSANVEEVTIDLVGIAQSSAMDIPTEELLKQNRISGIEPGTGDQPLDYQGNSFLGFNVPHEDPVETSAIIKDHLQNIKNSAIEINPDHQLNEPNLDGIESSATIKDLSQNIKNLAMEINPAHQLNEPNLDGIESSAIIKDLSQNIKNLAMKKNPAQLPTSSLDYTYSSSNNQSLEGLAINPLPLLNDQVPNITISNGTSENKSTGTLEEIHKVPIVSELPEMLTLSPDSLGENDPLTFYQNSKEYTKETGDNIAMNLRQESLEILEESKEAENEEENLEDIDLKPFTPLLNATTDSPITTEDYPENNSDEDEPYNDSSTTDSPTPTEDYPENNSYEDEPYDSSKDEGEYSALDSNDSDSEWNQEQYDNLEPITEIENVSLLPPAIGNHSLNNSTAITENVSTLKQPPLTHDDAEWEIVKPQDIVESLDELITIIGNWMQETSGANKTSQQEQNGPTEGQDNNNYTKQEQQQQPLEQQQGKLQENATAMVNCSTAQTMQLTTLPLPTTTMATATATPSADTITTQEEDYILRVALAEPIENQKEGIGKWSTFKNNHLNNDSLTKAGNDDATIEQITKENANVDVHTAAHAEQQEEQKKNEEDYDDDDDDVNNVKDFKDVQHVENTAVADVDVDVDDDDDDGDGDEGPINDKDLRLETKVKQDMTSATTNGEGQLTQGEQLHKEDIHDKPNNQTNNGPNTNNEFKISTVMLPATEAMAAIDDTEGGGINEMSTIETKLVDISKLNNTTDMTIDKGVAIPTQLLHGDGSVDSQLEMVNDKEMATAPILAAAGAAAGNVKDYIHKGNEETTITTKQQDDDEEEEEEQIEKNTFVVNKANIKKGSNDDEDEEEEKDEELENSNTPDNIEDQLQEQFVRANVKALDAVAKEVEQLSSLTDTFLNTESFPDIESYHSNSFPTLPPTKSSKRKQHAHLHSRTPSDDHHMSDKHLPTQQAKEEITTTNWWHSLPYTEIRKFLNSIFDSVTTSTAWDVATGGDDLTLSRSLHPKLMASKSLDNINKPKGKRKSKQEWSLPPSTQQRSLYTVWQDIWSSLL